MANIDQELAQIKTAVYGEEMRKAISDAMVKINGDFVGMKNKINNQDAAIEEYSAQLGNRITEVQNIAEGKADDFYYDEENNLLYLKSEDEIISNGVTVAGSGGGGGGGSSGDSSIKFTVRNTNIWTAKTVSKDEECPITFTWSSIDEEQMETGGGVLQISIGSVNKANIPIAQGDVTVDVSKYLNNGSNSIIFLVMDSYGNRKSLRYQVTLVQFTLTSSFDASGTFTGDISFPYTAMAATVKTIHFLIDGYEYDTVVTSSTNQRTFIIPAQSHGSHSIRCYYEAEVDGQTIRSNELYYEFTCLEQGNVTPIISSDFNKTTATQYDRLVIPYTVYNPTATTTPINIKVNNVVVSSPTVDRSAKTFEYQISSAGNLKIEIVTGTQGSSDYASKVFNLTVSAADVEIAAETDGLELYLTSNGRSNDEVTKDQWKYNDISATLTGFNWRINGWIPDSENITALRVSDDARVTIPFKIFENDFKENGKTIEVEFATRDVIDYSAVVLSCMSGNIGLQITPQMVYFNGAQTKLTAPYKDGEHIRLAIVVSRQNNYRTIKIFINGIASGAIQYASGERFSQLTPVDITIGSNDCGIDIYNIRVYNTELTDRQIVNNWVADTQIGSLMIDRYNRNDIFNENTGEITIDSLPSTLPYMVMQAAEIPTYKGDKKTISVSYTDPTNGDKSFTATGVECDAQGTSSSIYYRKNYDFKFKQGFVTRKGTIDKYALRTGSIPFNRFVVKADVASSESTNNTGLTMFYNDSCPYKIPEMLENDKIRWGIEGIPIALFWYNTETNTTEFLGKGNFNLPKRCSDPLGYSGNDESWEWERNNSLNVKFQDDDFTTQAWSEVDQQYYPAWYDDFEARFPSDEWRDYSKIKELLSFVKSTNRETATNENLPSPVSYTLNTTITLTNYSSDSSYTVTDEMQDDVATGNKVITFTKDTPAYRLTKFRAEFPDYAEIESFTYYYLFTEQFLMIDSRAKNMFIGFHGSPVTSSKVQYIDRKAVCEPYDMDTAIGTNNSGVLMFGYWLEDTDTVDSVISGAGGGSNAPVFNAQDSVLWNNFRDAFAGERTQMYRTLRADGIWSYNTIEQRYEEHQSKWPEALYNEDGRIKYLIPLTNPVTVDEDTGELIRTDRYLTMLQGNKESQRKWWLSNRFRYMDSKYSTGDASSRTINMRLFNSGTLNLKTAINMYAGVSFGGGTTVSLKRTDANTNVAFPYTMPGTVTEMETWIYSADMITDVGDLSVFYPNELDFSKATKLRNLKIGDATAGYSNSNLTTLNVQNCAMLEKIDVRNCPRLGITVNLEGSPLLKEAYFEGTAITGVDLVDGCVIEKLHLPSTITALTLMNLNKLTDLVIPDYSHITRLMVTNMDSSVFDIGTVLTQIPDNAQVNIQGIAMEAANSAAIDAFLAKLDKFRGVTRDKSATGEWMYHDYDTAQVAGTIHTTSLTGAQLADYNDRYPYLVVTADHITCNLYYDSADGTSNIHTESVADGGNGTWTGTATKDSDAQYNYTFAGWSKNMNSQTADASATQAVTMDRHIYAAFSRTLRSHPITFKNDDNTTLQSSNWNYGTTPSYSGSTPVSSDSTNGPFKGWSPSITPVTGPATYTATYQSSVEDAEISDDWNGIIDSVVYGTYDSKYKVGNYKALDVGTEGSHDVQIVTKDEDEDADGNPVALTFVSKTILSTIKRMNATNTTSGGYPATEMKTTTLPAIKALMPAAVTNHMKPVKKTSYDASGSDLTSYEDLWLCSYREIFGGTNYEKTGPVYSSIYKDATSRIKQRNGSASSWWLRSASNSSYFRCVNDYGYNYGNYAGNTIGVVFGFSLSPDTIHESWEEISGAISDGTYKTKYAIGDTKAIDLGDQGMICMQIAAFDADTDADGNTVPITWVTQQILPTNKRMNATGTTSGGYPATEMKTTTLPALYDKLPTVVKSMIVPVQKTSYDVGTSSDLTSTENIWLLSYREVFGGTDREKAGPIYSSLFTSSSTRIKKQYGTGSAGNWWLRSANNSYYFRCVSGYGSYDYNYANYTYGVVFGFSTRAVQS